MRTAMLVFMVGLVIIMLSPVVQAQAFGASPPEGLIVERKTEVSWADESEEYLRRDHESFLDKNVKTAATQTRKGAAFLKLEASHATEDVREAFTVSIRQLEKLAQGVEKGTVTSTHELQAAFTRANHAVAEQHFQEAAESWSKKEIRQAGHELKAATNQVELALARANRRLEDALER